jgi:hypothetical protein
LYKQDRQGEKSDRKREEKTRKRLERVTETKRDVCNNEKETKTYLVVEKGLT